MAERSFLFVGGCVRSGTTAITRLLNSHPEVIVGEERYIGAWGKHTVRADHFEKDRYLDYQEGDSTRGLYKFRDEAKRFGTERYVGDKHPFVFWLYRDFEKHFPGSRVVYILRNPVSVVESAQKRADDPDDNFNLDGWRTVDFWNDSIERTLAAISRGMKILVVCYEDVFASRDRASVIYRTLGLDPDKADWPRVDRLLARASKEANREVSRNEPLRKHVAVTASFDGYRDLASQCLFAGQAGQEPTGSGAVH